MIKLRENNGYIDLTGLWRIYTWTDDLYNSTYYRIELYLGHNRSTTIAYESKSNRDEDYELLISEYSKNSQ